MRIISPSEHIGITACATKMRLPKANQKSDHFGWSLARVIWHLIFLRLVDNAKKQLSLWTINSLFWVVSKVTNNCLVRGFNWCISYFAFIEKSESVSLKNIFHILLVSSLIFVLIEMLRIHQNQITQNLVHRDWQMTWSVTKKRLSPQPSRLID